ncbi:hypothetical protein C4J90_0601 [Pseudomonas sp. R2-60-08W]|nr:hypothetical protein C4J90_0601 [Pseudomonas sp. R2-60-08W]
MNRLVEGVAKRSAFFQFDHSHALRGNAAQDALRLLKQKFPTRI